MNDSFKKKIKEFLCEATFPLIMILLVGGALLTPMVLMFYESEEKEQCKYFGKCHPKYQHLRDRFLEQRAQAEANKNKVCISGYMFYNNTQLVDKNGNGVPCD